MTATTDDDRAELEETELGLVAPQPVGDRPPESAGSFPTQDSEEGSGGVEKRRRKRKIAVWTPMSLAMLCFGLLSGAVGLVLILYALVTG